MVGDEELIEQLKGGNRDAIREIYQKYRDDLLRIAGCMTGSWPEAEDCLHDVFVSLAEKAGRLRIRDNLKGYLVTAVANRARDRLRRRTRDRPLEKAVAQADGEIVAHDSNPAVALAETEANEQLHRAIVALPVEQRNVVTLHLHGGMTFEEIASQEGVSGNTIRSRYRYALDKLRTVLREGVQK